MDISKLLNRKNLIIARENAGFSTLRATRKISQSEKDIVASWESNEATPTWRQLEKLAKAYGISTFLFFSPTLIQRVKQIADYRSKMKEDQDDTDVKQLINLVVSRQKWISKKLSEAGREKNSLLGSGSNFATPRQLAEFIASSLNISVEDIKQIPGSATDSKKRALSYLIEKAEENGIFVGKTLAQYKISVDQMRGLFISDDYCPFIVINRKDALSAQIFTFVHELAHFFRKSDSISNSIDFREIQEEVDPEEVFCNRVAAELLLPARDFNKSFYTKDDIAQLASLYKLSRIFVFYRLKDLGLIRRFEVDELERTILAETKIGVAEKDSRKTPGGNHTNNMKDSNGSLFNRLIASAYFENQIGYVEASKLLRFSPEKI